MGIICHYGFNSVELQLRLTSVRLLLERFKRERDCYGTLSIRRYLWRLKGEERMITRFHRYLHAFRHARWLRARSMLCNDNGFSLSLSRVRKRRSLKFIAARYEAVATRSMTLLRQKALTSSSKASFISFSFENTRSTRSRSRFVNNARRRKGNPEDIWTKRRVRSCRCDSRLMKQSLYNSLS